MEPRIVIVDRQFRIVAAELELPELLQPLLPSQRLPDDLELLVRHAVSTWRGEIASCRESCFAYDAQLGIRVFPLLEGDLIRIGLSLQSRT